jgi:ComF family protein
MSVWSATDYRDRNIKKLIYALKYKNARPVAQTLGKLLAERLSSEKETYSEAIIVPVPLHPSKKRQRGYNQSELIAISLGKILNIPVALNILRRIKKGKPQISIENYSKRLDNIRGAFAPGRENGTTEGKTIILVDDVLTSGATMREAIKELRKMKPKRIISAVVARAK